ncbi:MAG TPA: hypothetical protein VEC13_01965 [Candidatus Paceibacterota bacterium]|nr:hypothetical protein [Candidatus Paceibacterota bacterium]
MIGLNDGIEGGGKQENEDEFESPYDAPYESGVTEQKFAGLASIIARYEDQGEEEFKKYLKTETTEQLHAMYASIFSYLMDNEEKVKKRISQNFKGQLDVSTNEAVNQIYNSFSMITFLIQDEIQDRGVA